MEDYKADTLEPLDPDNGGLTLEDISSTVSNFEIRKNHETF